LAAVPDRLGRERLRSSWPRGPLLLAGALLAGGILLRLPVFTYAEAAARHAFNAHIFKHPGSYADAGQAAQRVFNRYIFQQPGSYSDISSLYFRDGLWLHHAPYFDYKFEYPVITGGFVWLVSLVHASVTSYTLASGALLALCGLVTVWLVHRYRGSRVWLLAAAPVLGLDVLLNWDLVGIVMTAAALVLYQRRRDAWAGGFLALGVWAKLFPALVLPVIVLARARERAWRELARGLGGFAAVSAIVNLPVAIQPAARGGLFVVRSGWAYFYTFNERRRDVGGLWWFFGWLHPKAPEINRISAVLMIIALAAVAAAMLLGARRVAPSELVAPAVLALVAWFLFINKIYSPQFGLWVVLALALAGAPLWLAITFIVVDTAFYWVSFLGFLTSGHWYFPNVIRPAAGAREVVLLAAFAWGIQRLARAAPPLRPAEQAGWRNVDRTLAAAPTPP
jgi:hypothetical protein